ncbi:HET-domain-containing protein [Annulohypoxylon bovei var. microspora]|nr:HET-domain-containing protein [Annulohypoxylon bovei var. microspora]
MWLIDTVTYKLKLVTEPTEYAYAILSHTWEEDEISFQEFQNPSAARGARGGNGFSKIQRTCQLAAERGLRYAWVDTCCIDKSSSAELSEAINSMFRWYAHSAMCIVFLADLPPESSFEDHFPRCRWLTRGWTLQELVAPRTLEFYDASWRLRGRKPELNSYLASVTRIDEAVLRDSQSMFEVPIARRMSWASMRQTTRVEDKAYCLMGIFGVNMPMIYGEGERAFTRLQEEIAKDTTDPSLFAWVDLDPGTAGWMQQNYRGIFARSPREFASCHSLRPRIRDAVLDKEFTITNKGLRIETALVNVPSASQDLVWNLGVSERDDWPKDNVCGWVGIYLAKTANGYVRSKPWCLFIAEPGVMRNRCETSLIYIRKELRASETEWVEKRFHRALCVDSTQASCQIVAALPQQLWDQNRCLFLNQGQGINAYLLLRFSLINDPQSIVQLLVTCSTMGEPICVVWTEDHPLWNHLLQFMENAEEMSDYVAADYLKIHFLSLRWSEPPPFEVDRVRYRRSNVMINLKAELKPHIFQAQPCYRLDLVLEQTPFGR